MIIEFNDNALKELYLYGSTTDRVYKKLSKEVVKQYIKTVNYIKSVQRIEDLFLLNRYIMRKRKVISKDQKRYG